MKRFITLTLSLAIVGGILGVQQGCISSSSREVVHDNDDAAHHDHDNHDVDHDHDHDHDLDHD